MICRSENRRFRNGCTSSSVEGPPIFIITIAVGGFEAEVAKDRLIALDANDLKELKNENQLSMQLIKLFMCSQT
jgi:hypothetical protein